MDINRFKQVHSNLISDFRKETPRSPPFRSNKFTTAFINWLSQERNIIITYKGQKINSNPNNRCNICNREFDSKHGLTSHKWRHKEIKLNFDSNNHIHEFFLNFLNEHTYFSKNIIIGIYKDKVHPPITEDGNIKRDFASIIRYYIEKGMLERYSQKTYKINKDMVN